MNYIEENSILGSILKNFYLFDLKVPSTVRLIETVHLIETTCFLRLYGTFNRDVLKFLQTVRLIGTIRLIGTVRLIETITFLRSYGTFNRDVLKFFQTVRLIEQYA